MKQLFVLKTDSVITPTTDKPQDLTKVLPGTIGIWQLDNDAAFIATAPTGDFAIAYGRPNSVPVVVEVGYRTAIITKSEPKAGTKFKAEVTIPTPSAGLNYTLVLIKKGAVKHERNTWTVTDNGSHKTTAEDMAKSLGTQLQNMVDAGNPEINIKVTVADAKVTIEGLDYQDWELQAADDLYGTEITTTNHGMAPTNDGAYVKNLASVCAQNRGFNNVYQDGATIYPGYPMDVEDTDYKIYNIHHQVGRKASRTRDEAVWQDVIIAVPTANSTATGLLDTILDF